MRPVIHAKASIRMPRSETETEFVSIIKITRVLRKAYAKALNALFSVSSPISGN